MIVSIKTVKPSRVAFNLLCRFRQTDNNQNEHFTSKTSWILPPKNQSTNSKQNSKRCDEMETKEFGKISTKRTHVSLLHFSSVSWRFEFRLSTWDSRMFLEHRREPVEPRSVPTSMWIDFDVAKVECFIAMFGLISVHWRKRPFFFFLLCLSFFSFFSYFFLLQRSRRRVLSMFERKLYLCVSSHLMSSSDAHNRNCSLALASRKLPKVERHTNTATSQRHKQQLWRQRRQRQQQYSV